MKEVFGGAGWTQWPEDIRMHYGPALDYYRTKLYFDVEFHKYLQFKFDQQWTKLKKYANDKDKLNQKMAELYRKENISPMSGCLPMLISMPLLFIMFAASFLKILSKFIGSI